MIIKNKTKRNRNNLGEGGQKISHGDFSSAYSLLFHSGPETGSGVINYWKQKNDKFLLLKKNFQIFLKNLNCIMAFVGYQDHHNSCPQKTGS